MLGNKLIDARQYVGLETMIGTPIEARSDRRYGKKLTKIVPSLSCEIV